MSHCSDLSPAEIEYFDPRLDDSHGPGEVVTVGQDTYYRNVYLFLDQARMIHAVKGGSIVRNGLMQCLRGTALNWYTSELDSDRKAQLTQGFDLNNWRNALEARFKLDEHEALILLNKEAYSLEDVKNKRSLATYVQNVTRLGRATGWSVPNSLN